MVVSGETIAAVATARGEAAIAIVRVSGPAAQAIGAAVLARPALPARRVCHGWAHALDGERIDEVLLLSMPGPRSFTGEDVVELHGHGGVATTEALLDAVLGRGARLARPGEFTERAFQNGRIDLVQAEAVCELIAARGAQARRTALRRLSGELSQKIAGVLDRIEVARMEVEGCLDFPDDVPVRPGDLHSAREDLRALVEGHRSARVAQDGALVVLVGAPNTGKSSLFNALVGDTRALVSPTPHTTRDWIEARIVWDSMVIRLVDTAGLADGVDGIEAASIKVTEGMVERGDLVVEVVSSHDRPATFPQGLLVANKCDLWPERPRDRLCVSALTGESLHELRGAILSRLVTTPAEDAVVSERQHQLLVEALKVLEDVKENEPLDAWAARLRVAGDCLGEVTGRSVNDEVIAGIFARFCLGK